MTEGNNSATEMHEVNSASAGCAEGQHAASDVDLAVLLDNPEAGDSFQLIADLKAAFRRPVDVVWLHRADPLLQWQVMQLVQLLLGDEGELARKFALILGDLKDLERLSRLGRDEFAGPGNLRRIVPDIIQNDEHVHATRSSAASCS